MKFLKKKKNTDLVKEFFIRRDFTSVADEIEKEKRIQ